MTDYKNVIFFGTCTSSLCTFTLMSGTCTRCSHVKFSVFQFYFENHSSNHLCNKSGILVIQRFDHKQSTTNQKYHDVDQQIS